MKKLLSAVLAAFMLLTFVACDGDYDFEDETTRAKRKTKNPRTTTVAPETTTAPQVTTYPHLTTQNTTTRRPKKEETSFQKRAESDYDVQPIDPLTLPVDLTADQVIDKLPKKLWVKVPATFSGSSEELFKAAFSSLDDHQTIWDYFDLDEVGSVEGGVIASAGGSPRFMTAVKNPAWGYSDTDYFVNYAVRATISAKHVVEGNFGLTFRVSEIIGTDADDYFGMYVGIDEAPITEDGAGKSYITVGTSKNGTWNELKNTTIEHATETPYDVEILVCYDRYIVKIDGTQVLEGEIDPEMNQGSAGFRSWKQSCECSDFSVRSLDADDYALFGGYFDVQLHDVKWSCFDYEPKKGKYGFFGEFEGFEGKKVQAKALVTIDPKAKS